MKLTIITTVFHDTEGLKKTCLSLKSLTEGSPPFSWEHLIVDSSPQENEKLIQTLQQENWPLKHIICSPQGVYPAMNLGIGQSCGEVIWFLNSGDILVDAQNLKLALDQMKEQVADVLIRPVQVVSAREAKVKKISNRLILNLLG